MYLLDAAQFCSKTKALWGLIGTALTILKIVVPIILVVLGSIDLLKAVTSDDKDMIKKQGLVLGKRALAGIIIFFIPTIIEGILSMLSATSDAINQAGDCWKCAIGSMQCDDKPTGNG